VSVGVAINVAVNEALHNGRLLPSFQFDVLKMVSRDKHSSLFCYRVDDDDENVL
jgi:hypothetical protein